MTGTFEGVGTLQFSPDNKYAYAYSGVKPVTGASSANTKLLDIQTNSEYIVATLQAYSQNRSAAQMYFEVEFNSVLVLEVEFDNDGGVNAIMDGTMKLLIPPFTHVEVYGGMETGTNENYTVSLIGKVHGAIQQENLEAITDNNKWASK